MSFWQTFSNIGSLQKLFELGPTGSNTYIGVRKNNIFKQIKVIQNRSAANTGLSLVGRSANQKRALDMDRGEAGDRKKIKVWK